MNKNFESRPVGRKYSKCMKTWSLTSSWNYCTFMALYGHIMKVDYTVCVVWWVTCGELGENWEQYYRPVVLSLQYAQELIQLHYAITEVPTNRQCIMHHQVLNNHYFDIISLCRSFLTTFLYTFKALTGRWFSWQPKLFQKLSLNFHWLPNCTMFVLSYIIMDWCASY